MSQRSLQLPAVTSVHVGVAKQASTPSRFATSFVVSESYPVTWFAVSWVGAHFVPAGRVGSLDVHRLRWVVSLVISDERATGLYLCELVLLRVGRSCPGAVVLVVGPTARRDAGRHQSEGNCEPFHASSFRPRPQSLVGDVLPRSVISSTKTRSSVPVSRSRVDCDTSAGCGTCFVCASI